MAPLVLQMMQMVAVLDVMLRFLGTEMETSTLQDRSLDCRKTPAEENIEVGDADGEGDVGDAFYALGDGAAGGAVGEGAVGDASVGGARLVVPMMRVLQVMQRVLMLLVMPMVRAPPVTQSGMVSLVLPMVRVLQVVLWMMVPLVMPMVTVLQVI